ncbi:MAG: DNA-binding response regulator [candidate division WS6 bacterium GW2011_GWF2_39_15]|uniref:DNA-binding response regulator n=1 Tax=candidate division WS6 bacterium GW2011_GWF2_39_15 TaxID=1619100 RepID=A0A0G0Q705_9BACT|nr:MAG: DNA-binding response regulator [candidate division WS6 bacterium GW2011_GWF2_39_15]
MNFKPTVLVVEDDKRINRLIESSLSKDFNVISTRTYREATSNLQRKHIDVACLDIMLPDGSGLDICKIIKKDSCSTKIIILSKKTQIGDRINSFETGADDYLSKPFFVEELNIRIKRLLPGYHENRLVKGHYTLNLEDSTISYKGNKMYLTKSQMVILGNLLSPCNKYCDLDSFIKLYHSYSLVNPTKGSIKVALSRLGFRFKKEWGIDLLHSRYGYGYYLKYE